MTEEVAYPALIPIDPDKNPELAREVDAQLERAMRRFADEIRAAWHEAGE